MSTQPTITVYGHGAVRATPDLVRITLSVESRAAGVAAAYSRAGERVSSVLHALRRAGVADTDIATSGLSVRTETVYTDRGTHEITGYLATTALTVSLRESTDPAGTIAAAVAAGGDDVRLGGLDRVLSEAGAALVRARDAAYDDARVKAEQYATRAHARLGAVLDITEHPGGMPTPFPRAAEIAAPMAFAAASVPVELGDTEITADVRVTWALD
ncbi:SIMPL domain-containing protein [Nocardia thailandica]|uniref:SIMPL domain-containing protein n=1 Tax=Nocardia thailandica TaxID=257275 RepID=UPI0002F05A0B|nr:SIMPL domain-containing protein [Nocardia thailandica]